MIISGFENLYLCINYIDTSLIHKAMFVNRRERDFFAAGLSERGMGQEKPHFIGISRDILSFY